MNGKASHPHLSGDFQFGTRWLGIAHHGDLLQLVTDLAGTVEGDSDISFSTRSDAALGIAGHCAATGGATAADNQIGIAGVAEMEPITDVLACRETAKIVQLLVEGHHWHSHILVISVGTIGIIDEVYIRIAVTAATRSQCKAYHHSKYE